jgi:uncharacterized repeat protein (TIGR01451 family)
MGMLLRRMYALLKRHGCLAGAAALGATCLFVGPAATSASAAPAAPNFSICPAVDVATGCAVVIVVNADGSRTIDDNPGGTMLGVYDGSDDSLIGIQNNSASPVSSLVLSSTDGVFGFDGDGPCTETTPPIISNCSADPSGYGGPGVTYSNISTDMNTGEIDFSPAIAAGGTAWTALEATPDASTLSVPSSVGITADSPVAPPSSADGFTVTVTNTTTAAISLSSIVDTLPAGFTYTAGTTTGGSTLTWTGPFSVPANGTLVFDFKVTIASTAGPYTDSVTANTAATLTPATATAVITNPTVVGSPAFPIEGLPIAFVVGAGFLYLAWRRWQRPTSGSPTSD